MVDDTVWEFSSVYRVNNEAEFLLSGAQFAVIEQDFDEDGRADNFDIELKFNRGTSTVSSMIIVIAFDYNLEKYVNMNFKSMAIIRINAPSSGNIGRALVHGQLKLWQWEPVEVGDSLQELYDDDFFELMRKYSLDEIEELNYDWNCKKTNT